MYIDGEPYPQDLNDAMLEYERLMEEVLNDKEQESVGWMFKCKALRCLWEYISEEVRERMDI